MQCSKRAENVLRLDKRQQSSDEEAQYTLHMINKMKLKSRYIIRNYKDDLKAAGEKTDFLQKNNDTTNKLSSCTNERQRRNNIFKKLKENTQTLGEFTTKGVSLKEFLKNILQREGKLSENHKCNTKQ